MDTVLDLHILFTVIVIRFFRDEVQSESTTALYTYLATLTTQMFQSAHLASESLVLALEAALQLVRSDFKKFLIILLLCDLRTPGHEEHLRQFISETNPTYTIEISYVNRAVQLSGDGNDGVVSGAKES